MCELTIYSVIQFLKLKADKKDEFQLEINIENIGYGLSVCF